MRRSARIRRILIASVNCGNNRDALAFVQRDTGRHDLLELPAAAVLHGVIGFVYHWVKNVPGIDAELLAALQARYHWGLRIHLQAVADLARLGPVLANAEIPWLVIGGPVAVETLYSRPGLRSYDGIEIAMRADAGASVTEILRRSGCRVFDPQSDSRQPGPVRCILWHGTAATLASRLPMASRADFSGDGLFTRSQVVLLQGTPMRVPETTDLTILLALESAYYGGRLGPLKDLERVITSQRVDWRLLTDRAGKWGLANVLGDELWRARQLVGAAVPEDVLASLPPRRGLARIVFGWNRPIRLTLPSPSRSAFDEPLLTRPRHHRVYDKSERALIDLLRLAPRAPGPMDLEGWQQLLALAQRERVAPLVLASLQTLGASGPQEVLDPLNQARQQAEEQVSKGFSQLAALLRRLSAGGIHPVVLKGAAVARVVYPHAALRPFGDVDFLIRVDDIMRVHAVLVELGYALAGGTPTVDDMTWRHARGYYDPHRGRLSVDVHWRYIGYPHLLPLDYEGVFLRASHVVVDGQVVMVPSPEDMVVSSSVYFAREIWYRKPRIRYLRDLAEVVHRCVVDWDQVLRSVKATRLLQSPLFLTLAAATDLLGAPVPDPVLKSLRPGTPAATPLLDHVRLNVLRRETSRSAVIQLAWMRWLDDPSLLHMAAWVKSLFFVPSSLAPSQQRWLRSLWRP